MPLRITEQQAQRLANQAFIAELCARTPAERELDLLDHQDSPWTSADKARRAHLMRVIAAGG